MNLILPDSRAPGLVEMPSGLLVPEDFAVDMVKEQRRLTCVDFFSGCGGMSLGCIRGGLNVVAAVELDMTCIHTYMVNLCRYGQVQMHFIEPADEVRAEAYFAKIFLGKKKEGQPQMEFSFAGSGWAAGQPDHVPGVAHMVVGDVRKLKGTQLLKWIGMERGDLGCVVGSPPCQGFSYANAKRGPEDPRNSLVFEFARMIVELQPKSCVMENVPGIVSMKTADGVPVVDRFCQILRDGGFHGVEAMESLMRGRGAVGAILSKREPKPARKSRPKKPRRKHAA